MKAKQSHRKQRALRRRNLAISIDLAWQSLRTHLADAVKAEAGGNERWHAKCVREYAQIIYAQSVELHELAKVDFKKRFKNLVAKIK